MVIAGVQIRVNAITCMIWAGMFLYVNPHAKNGPFAVPGQF